MKKVAVELSNVSINYDAARDNPVVANINLKIEAGSFSTIIGKSGSGKSSILHAIAGLVPASTGSIRHKNINVLGPSTSRSVIFQDLSIFPWLNVSENIALPLKLQRLSSDEIVNHVNSWLDRFGLRDSEKSSIDTLSGGMKQRVALARAFVSNGDILLLDEPFNGLDPLLKEKLYTDLLSACENSGKTIVLVTHDIEEAIFLSDCVYLLGLKSKQIDSVFKVEFQRPRNLGIRKNNEFVRRRFKIHDELMLS